MSEVGMRLGIGASATVKRAQPEPEPKIAIHAHVRCLGPDGKVKWEDDIVPMELSLMTHVVDTGVVQREAEEGA